jgi:hypothetical protein
VERECGNIILNSLMFMRVVRKEGRKEGRSKWGKEEGKEK